MKYEYKIIDFFEDSKKIFTKQEVEQLLNKLGEEGWCLATNFVEQFIFVREKQSDENLVVKFGNSVKYP